MRTVSVGFRLPKPELYTVAVHCRIVYANGWQDQLRAMPCWILLPRSRGVP